MEVTILPSFLGHRVGQTGSVTAVSKKNNSDTLYPLERSYLSWQEQIKRLETKDGDKSGSRKSSGRSRKVYIIPSSTTTGWIQGTPGEGERSQTPFLTEGTTIHKPWWPPQSDHWIKSSDQLFIFLKLEAKSDAWFQCERIWFDGNSQKQHQAKFTDGGKSGAIVQGGAYAVLFLGISPQPFYIGQSWF